MVFLLLLDQFPLQPTDLVPKASYFLSRSRSLIYPNMNPALVDPATTAMSDEDISDVSSVLSDAPSSVMAVDDHDFASSPEPNMSPMGSAFGRFQINNPFENYENMGDIAKDDCKEAGADASSSSTFSPFSTMEAFPIEVGHSPWVLDQNFD